MFDLENGCMLLLDAVYYSKKCFPTKKKNQTFVKPIDILFHSKSKIDIE